MDIRMVYTEAWPLQVLEWLDSLPACWDGAYITYLAGLLPFEPFKTGSGANVTTTRAVSQVI